MAIKQQTIRAYQAGVAVNIPAGLREKREEAKKSGKWLKIAAMGTGFLGAPGLAVAHALERKRNKTIYDKEMGVLADHYRMQVGAVLGMNPENVGPEHLADAANMIPALKQAIADTEKDRKDGNRISMMGNGAILAAGGILPGVSGVGKIALDIGSNVVGEKTAQAIWKQKTLTVQAVVEHIDAKRQAGEAITEFDIAMLRVSQDVQWQEAFEKRYGTAFHKMQPERIKEVLSTMPELNNGAAKDAYAVNHNLVSVQDLVMGLSGPRSNFAESVGRTAPASSHLEALKQRDQAAAGQQTARA